ncbi:MAG: hypothetical protein LUD12_14945 [Lachnospiraceae bacterium]|nr:hypothetical protein [Lachnospiraceae bacterium]
MKMVHVSLHTAWRFLREIPFRSLKKLLPLMSNPYEKIYQKELDYVVISMVAVRREFQGQGYLRVLLAKHVAHTPTVDFAIMFGKVIFINFNKFLLYLIIFAGSLYFI